MRISLLHGIVETYPAANQMDERVEYAEYPKHTEDVESEKYFCPYFVDVAGNSDFARRFGRACFVGFDGIQYFF